MLRRLAFLAVCVLVLGSMTWGQPGGTLRGVVLDSANLEPLPFANIFVNNTTIGTSAGVDGKFELKNLPEGQTDVVFSYVGYQSRILRFYFKGDLEIDAGSISLIQKREELQEVQVKSKRDKEWEKQFRNFEKFLLGDANMENCKIQNPWVINFSENSSKTSLQATALEPIEIHNYGLGYKIFFHMSGFSANPSSYTIVGQFRFEEAEPLDQAQAIRWKQNRIDTYHGSERHLFKSIIDGRAAEEGFRLYFEKPGYALATRSDVFGAELGKSVVEYDLKGAVSKGGFQYFIQLPPRLEVHYMNEYATRKYYKDVPFQVSWLEIQNGQVEVNANGVILNSIDLVTSGAMSNLRVADLLPLDYKPYTEIGNVKVHPVARLTGWSKYRRMQEFTYVQTDKPYYYPGERIWMKAYMRYRDPELIDSLSKVLYVELIDNKKRCLDRKQWQIENGYAWGHIDLPDTIRSGNYHIRAYTSWMRNYGSENFYVRPLPILSLTDKVVDQPVELDTTAVIVSIKPNKPVYQTRDSIALAIDLTDQQGHAVGANLSVVVTDAVLVKSVADAPSIVDFTLPDERTSVDRNFAIRYAMEKGIDFAGTFTDDRGKPAKASLSVVQREFNTAIPVTTDSKGYFEVTGLNFEGTMNFGFQAINKKGKPFGTVTLVEKDYPLVDFDPAVLRLDVQDSASLQTPVLTYRPGADTRVLENVTVKAPALENVDPMSISIYGKPDYVVQGTELQQVFTGNNLIQALQGKVPGLRVTYGWDENNQDTYRVRLRGGSSSLGIGLSAIEPVLIVDGIPFSADPNASIANFISNIPVQTVERVEVITSAVPLFGLRGTNGAILIYTKNSGVYSSAVPDTDPNMQVIAIEGYQQRERFKAPKHPDGETDSSPDLRSTIHWEPVLVANKEGHAELSFYAADLQGLYRIVVEGISSDGRIVRGEHTISIENP